jgi:hypothetical protein
MPSLLVFIDIYNLLMETLSNIPGLLKTDSVGSVMRC